jgi:RIO-like serine/threonine protein kinase
LFAGEVIISSVLGPGYIIVCTFEEGCAFDDETWLALGAKGRSALREKLLMAFQFLRRHNMVQGDAQKSNILIKPNGDVILIDFEEVTDNSRNCGPETPELRHIMKAPHWFDG